MEQQQYEEDAGQGVGQDVGGHDGDDDSVQAETLLLRAHRDREVLGQLDHQCYARGHAVEEGQGVH